MAQWMPKSAVPVGQPSEHEQVMDKIFSGEQKEQPKAWMPSSAKPVDNAESWADKQVEDIEGVAQTIAALGASGALAIPGALQAAGNWILTGDVEQAKAGMQEWISKAYMPTNDLAAGVMEKLGGGYEHLAQSTEELLGPEARMLSEIGMVAAPFTKGVAKPRPMSGKQLPKERRFKGVESDIIDTPDIILAKNAPDVGGGFRKMEAETFRLGVQHDAAVQPFVDAMTAIKKAYPDVYKKINDQYFQQLSTDRVISNQAVANIKKTLSDVLSRKRVEEVMQPLEAAIRQRGIDLIEVAPKTELVKTNYLPLRILHPEKLKVDPNSKLGNELARINSDLEAGKIDVHTADMQRTKAIIAGGEQTVSAKRSAHEKARKHRALTDEQKQAYAPIEEALANYFTETGRSIAERRFLGKSDTYEASIGKFMEKYADHPSAGAIRKVLEARFGKNARRTMSKGWNAVKELGYLGTIADFASAIVQLGDLAGSFARQGIRPTAKAIRQSVGGKYKRRGRGAVDPEQVGVIDIMHEMATAKGGINKLLDKTLSYSGFKMVDKFGKRVLLTAARNRLMKQAKTNHKRLRLDYNWMGEAEFKRFKHNLEKGDVTNPDVQFALVNELMDVQPISLSQMPIKYLQSPTGRIFYSLKTWAIRQINRYREDVIKGNPERALKHAAAVYAATESIDLSKDILSAAITGQELTMEEVQDEAINNMLRMMFLSSYTLGKVKGGNTDDAFQSIAGLTPPAIGMVGDVYKGIWKALTDGDTPTKAIKRIPIVGRSAAALVEEPK